MRDTSSNELLGVFEAPKVMEQRLTGEVREPSRRLRYERQDRRCNLCLERMPYEKMTSDHRVPRAKAGSLTLENLELLCDPCNQRKGDRPIAEALWTRWGTYLRSSQPPLDDE